MNLNHGSTPAPANGVAKDMGELTHDIVSLAELQFELFRRDCREGLTRMLIPLALRGVRSTSAGRRRSRPSAR